MIKHINDIPAVPTSHQSGMKQVLLAKGECKSGITQIAVTEVKAGDIIQSHKHWSMEEYFYVLDGEIEIIKDGVSTVCHAGDFIYIEFLSRHEMKALSDTKLLSIGAEIK